MPALLVIQPPILTIIDFQCEITLWQSQSIPLKPSKANILIQIHRRTLSIQPHRIKYFWLEEMITRLVNPIFGNLQVLFGIVVCQDQCVKEVRRCYQPIWVCGKPGSQGLQNIETLMFQSRLQMIGSHLAQKQMITIELFGRFILTGKWILYSLIRLQQNDKTLPNNINNQPIKFYISLCAFWTHLLIIYETPQISQDQFTGLIQAIL